MYQAQGTLTATPPFDFSQSLYSKSFARSEYALTLPSKEKRLTTLSFVAILNLTTLSFQKRTKFSLWFR
jgi:hypothetical protein